MTRNEKVVDLYNSEVPVSDIAAQVGITERQVVSILRRRVRGGDSVSVAQRKLEYVGGYVTPRLKHRIRVFAREQKMSVSEAVSDALDRAFNG